MLDYQLEGIYRFYRDNDSTHPASAITLNVRRARAQILFALRQAQIDSVNHRCRDSRIYEREIFVLAEVLLSDLEILGVGLNTDILLNSVASHHLAKTTDVHTPVHNDCAVEIIEMLVVIVALLDHLFVNVQASANIHVAVFDKFH
jgi:hypothetical protein